MLTFSIYILRNLKNFFKVLTFPSYALKKEFKNFILWKNLKYLRCLLSNSIFLKNCQNITVLAILERPGFKNFSCRPTMVASNTFQCSMASSLWNPFRQSCVWHIFISNVLIKISFFNFPIIRKISRILLRCLFVGLVIIFYFVLWSLVFLGSILAKELFPCYRTFFMLWNFFHAMELFSYRVYVLGPFTEHYNNL